MGRSFFAVGLSGFIWLVFWWNLYRTPAAVASEVEIPPPPPWQLFRTRFVWSFTLCKVFMDPAWYFYIFWFPEYLKRARHFDMAAIGKYAWIPFFIAGLGNILGGVVSAFFVAAGIVRYDGAQIGGYVFRGLDDGRHSGRSGASSWMSHRFYFDCDDGLYGKPGEYVVISGGRVSEECGGVRLWAGEHGRGLWRDAV